MWIDPVLFAVPLPNDATELKHEMRALWSNDRGLGFEEDWDECVSSHPPKKKVPKLRETFHHYRIAMGEGDSLTIPRELAARRSQILAYLALSKLRAARPTPGPVSDATPAHALGALEAGGDAGDA